jgi:predicted permease
VSPALGRWPTEEEDIPGGAEVVLLAWRVWKEVLGGDPNVVGRAVLLDGRPVTVVGVMPTGFDFPAGSEVWSPLRQNFALPDDESHSLEVLARLSPNSSLPQATAQLNALTARINALATGIHHLSPADHPLRAIALKDHLVAPVRTTLWLLQTAVLLVWLLVIGNVSSVFLARAEARTRELAIRVALGARQARLARQLVTEATVLALLAGAVGLLAAIWGIDLILIMIPRDVPRADQIRIDVPVLMFTLALSLGTGVFCGLSAFFHIRASKVHLLLKDGGQRMTASIRQGRFRAALVAGQLALALVILVACVTTVRGLMALLGVNVGFPLKDLIAANVNIPRGTFDDRAAVAFWARLQESLRGLPDVQSATLVGGLPPVWAFPTGDVEITGRTALAGEHVYTHWQVVGDQPFETLGVPILGGRSLNEHDDADAPLAVVVNHSFAVRYFSEGRAVGWTIRLGPNRPDSPLLRIVGVVGDIKQQGLGKPAVTEVFVPFRQANRILQGAPRAMHAVVRTRVPPEQLARVLERATVALDPQVAVSSVRTLTSVMSEAVGRDRFVSFVLSAFAVLSLLLGASGVYGMMSYAVSQRRQEIGVRSALGAPPAQIVREVFLSGMKVVGVGLAIGILGVVVLGIGLRESTSWLFPAASPTSPMPIILVPLIIVLTAAVACWLPALRASHISPMVALRSD